MDDSAFLSREDVQRLTGRRRKKEQIAHLQAEKKYPELAAEIREYQLRDMRAKAGTDVEEKRGMSEAKGLLGHTTETMTARYVRHRLVDRESVGMGALVQAGDAMNRYAAALLLALIAAGLLA